MSEHSAIKVGYDLDVYEKHGVKLPIYAQMQKCPHWLICGNSGSGKSYLTLMLLRNVLKEFREDVRLWIMDFKSSEDFSFLEGYNRYYCGAECAEGLEDYYREYQEVKSKKAKDGILRLIVFDEWAGFQIWEAQQNKKQAEKYKGHLLEILLMGRSMMCGVWVIMQRNDAKYIDGREQFFCHGLARKNEPGIQADDYAGGRFGATRRLFLRRGNHPNGRHRDEISKSPETAQRRACQAGDFGMPDESVRRREQSRINRQPDVPSLTRAAAEGKSAGL